jgi:hypothetical protein
MLDALEKYQRTQNLTEAKETSALSVVN